MPIPQFAFACGLFRTSFRKGSSGHLQGHWHQKPGPYSNPHVFAQARLSVERSDYGTPRLLKPAGIIGKNAPADSLNSGPERDNDDPLLELSTTSLRSSHALSTETVSGLEKS